MLKTLTLILIGAILDYLLAMAKYEPTLRSYQAMTTRLALLCAGKPEITLTIGPSLFSFTCFRANRPSL